MTRRPGPRRSRKGSWPLLTPRSLSCSPGPRRSSITAALGRRPRRCAGRPMLVVPFFADQPDNADRVRRLGMARTVARRSYCAAGPSGNYPAFSARRVTLCERTRSGNGSSRRTALREPVRCWNALLTVAEAERKSCNRETWKRPTLGLSPGNNRARGPITRPARGFEALDDE